MPEQENNMKMEIVNELLRHETEFTLPSECDSSFSYGLQYTQNMLSQTCFMSFIHSVVCLTTGPKPRPKRALHI